MKKAYREMYTLRTARDRLGLTQNVILTDNFILGHLIKDALNLPVISFQKSKQHYLQDKS